MATDEANQTEFDDPSNRPPPRPPSNVVAMWVLGAWMILAPLLMLGTIWLLTYFRGR